MKAILNFIEALFRLPVGNLIWVMVLGMTNMVAPLFFFDHIAAKGMFFATMLSFMIGVVMYKFQGMNRLMGLMHTPLLVAIYFLLIALLANGFVGVFGLWALVALILTSVSLILDIRDVILYIGGDREAKE